MATVTLIDHKKYRLTKALDYGDFLIHPSLALVGGVPVEMPYVWTVSHKASGLSVAGLWHYRDAVSLARWLQAAFGGKCPRNFRAAHRAMRGTVTKRLARLHRGRWMFVTAPERER